MTTFIPSTTTAAATAGSTSLSDLYGTAVKSLTARSTGLPAIDAQIRRDDARLSTLGRLANVLDDVKTVAGTLAASGLKIATRVDGKAIDARIMASGAAAGTHKVDVKQLAQAQQLSTVRMPSATTTPGWPRCSRTAARASRTRSAPVSRSSWRPAAPSRTRPRP